MTPHEIHELEINYLKERLEKAEHALIEVNAWIQIAEKCLQRLEKP